MIDGDGDVFVENGRGFSRLGVFGVTAVVAVEAGAGLVSAAFVVLLISSANEIKIHTHCERRAKFRKFFETKIIS